MKKKLHNAIPARLLKSEKDLAHHASAAAQSEKRFDRFVLKFFAMLSIDMSKLFFVIQHSDLPIKVYDIVYCVIYRGLLPADRPAFICTINEFGAN